MQSRGWIGRPILATQPGEGGEVQALTGSHRIAAARAAGLDEISVLLVTVVTSAGWDALAPARRAGYAALNAWLRKMHAGRAAHALLREEIQYEETQ